MSATAIALNRFGLGARPDHPAPDRPKLGVPSTLCPHSVIANLKDTQMKNVRVGQRATLSVDALGGEELTGKVSEIAPVTGSEFSVIRTDNASGNFTKVSQRVSVKILLDPDQPLLERLRPARRSWRASTREAQPEQAGALRVEQAPALHGGRVGYAAAHDPDLCR